jgi:hypothetical protein
MLSCTSRYLKYKNMHELTITNRYRKKGYSVKQGCAGAERVTGAMSSFFTGLFDLPVNAVQNISAPAADRFATNYNLPSCEARMAMLGPAAAVEPPLAPPQEEGMPNGEDTKSTFSLASTATTLSQEGTPSMVVKKNPLQKVGANMSYLGRRVSNWLVEVPMGITLFISQTSHCLPRSYNDRTVRDSPDAEVTGVRTGLVAAGKVRISCGVFIWRSMS